MRKLPRYSLRLLAGALLLTSAPRPWTQRAPDVEVWNEVDISVKLRHDLTLTAPLVLRDSTSLSDPQLFGLGPFLDLTKGRHLTLTAGYLYVTLPALGTGYTVYVPLAAVTWHESIGRLQLSDRNRAEGLLGVPNNPIRYRNKLLFSTSLAREHWLPFLSDEVFYDLSRNSWSQNRLQAGVGRALSERLRVDLFFLERNTRYTSPSATHAVGTTLEWRLTRATRRQASTHEEN